MSSYRLNIARISGLPQASKVAAAMESFGLPESEEFGVLNTSSSEQAVFGTIVRKSHQVVQKLDTESNEVTSAAVEKATVYTFAVNPSTGILETYSGSAASIEQVGEFLASSLAFGCLIEQIELDIPASIDKLSRTTEKFQLRSIRVSDYAHSSYVAGPYAPKFQDNDHGKAFLDEHSELVTAAGVRFATKTGRVNVSLSPKTCFSYSCNEDEAPNVKSILRKLI